MPSFDDHPLVVLAREIALEAHAGQVDKSGNPYYTHPLRVAAIAGRDPLATPEVIAACWLHDVIEDTPLTAAELAARGIPAEVVRAVDAVSKRSGEPMAGYAARIAAEPVAIRVKRADLADNSDTERLARLDARTQDRLRDKYARMSCLLDEAIRSASGVRVQDRDDR